MSLPTLQEVGGEVREFRSKHGPKTRLPEKIRQSAVVLAAQHGYAAVYRELGVCRDSVLRWQSPAPEAPSQVAGRAARRAKKIEFVEIKAAAEPRRTILSESHASAIEVARPDGWTVRVTGALAKDFADTMLGKFTI